MCGYADERRHPPDGRREGCADDEAYP